MEALRLILLTCEQKSFSASETIFNCPSSEHLAQIGA
jgi:hypothetical protein